MKRFFATMFLLLTLAGLGCSFIGSAVPSETTVTGELWYTRNRFFFGSDQVFYCPPPPQPGVAPQCVEAEIVD
jgi:hypothetical protein